MDQVTATKLLKQIRDDVTDEQGQAATDRFSSLRAVDAKTSETRRILDALPEALKNISDEMKNDENFQANSRRVRLESVQYYINAALRLLEAGAIKSKRTLVRAPDIKTFTGNLPGLDDVISKRWLEAQRCQHAGAYLAAVVLMGSILEGLLLARAQVSPETAFGSKKAPRGKGDKDRPIHEWGLGNLIDVAVDVGWINVDRGSFSHALRESRNVVHPWQQVTLGIEFDEATCSVCWEVLNASVGDLLESS